MSSISKKCKNSDENNERDRLSELPDQLLVHILSKMRTLDAVRTLQLRRFGNLWTLIPSLEFKDSEILSSKGFLMNGKSKDEYSRSDLNAAFTTYVRNVLLFHNRTTIDKYEFSIYELDWLGNNSRRNRAVLEEIKMWIKFAVQKEVKVIKLEFTFASIDGGWVLPRCLFTSQFLVELVLRNFVIMHIGHVEMVALKTLLLSEFDMSNEVFKKLISGCPSLQLVEIEDQHGLDELRFSAPSIEELYLCVGPCLLDCPSVKALNISLGSIYPVPDVVDVSSLREVVVTILDSADQINEVVKTFYKVEVFELRLVDVPLQLIVIDPNLPETRWKHLCISSGLHDEEQLHIEELLLSICRMLRSSPHLEEFVLHEEFPRRLSHEDCSNLILELPSPFVMPQLKTVTLRGYMLCCQGLLRVVEFFLKSAEVLEKIVIVPKKYEFAAIDEVEFVKKLSGFLRASTTARVVIGLNVY